MDFVSQCSHSRYPCHRPLISGSKCRLHKSCSPFLFLPYCKTSISVLTFSCSIAYILSGQPLIVEGVALGNLLPNILGDNRDKRFCNGLCADIFSTDNHLYLPFGTIRFLLPVVFLSSPILKSSFPDRAGERLETPRPVNQIPSIPAVYFFL